MTLSQLISRWKNSRNLPQDWCHTNLSRYLLPRFPSINRPLACTEYHTPPHPQCWLHNWGLLLSSSLQLLQLPNWWVHSRSTSHPSSLTLELKTHICVQAAILLRELITVTRFFAKLQYNDMSSSTLPSGGELDILFPEEQSQLGALWF